MPPNDFHLDTVLLKLSLNSRPVEWTIRNAVEGVQIFGGIGSGKTSGSGRTLALKYLSAGFGGLVLTVKPDERELWEEYCRLAGRGDDLIVVSPNSKHRFNFLEYESSEGKSTANVVQVLKTVIRASEEKAGGKSDDPFWETALDMLMSNVIDLSTLAYGKVSLQNLYDIAQGAPRPDGNGDGKAFQKAYTHAMQEVSRQIEEHKSRLTQEELSGLKDEETFDAYMTETLQDARTLKFVHQFFIESFVNLSEKTRSIIDFSFTGFLFNLLREPVFSMFCKYASTFTPEDCLKGKIILIDLPVKIYHKTGRDCQILFKYIWQRAMEKRNVKDNPRPVFLWADEAQNFLHEYDADYQATARSSRIATVYISQNLPNYHANMGGAKSEFKVKSFLGTLGTKIFHANADIETNRYASELIGDGYYEEKTQTVTAAGNFSASTGTAIKVERMVRPEQFTSLLTGGEQSDLKVECYIHAQGLGQKDGTSHVKATFKQNFILSPKLT